MKYYLGTHIGISKYSGFISNAINEILHLKGNFIQIFITNPKGRKVTIRSDEELYALNHYAKQKDVKIVIHAPYILNLAREFDKNSWYMKSLLEHLIICDKIGAIGVVIHFGKYLHLDKSEAIQNMYLNIKFALENSPMTSKIFLETSCGQGTELGYKLEEFKIIYDKFSEHDKKRLRICIDTCHIFVAGYDITTPEKVKEFIKLFNNIIGWKYVDLIHLNGSKYKFNSHLDRHEVLNKGHINMKGLGSFIKFVHKANIPIILETSLSNNMLDIVKKYF